MKVSPSRDLMCNYFQFNLQRKDKGQLVMWCISVLESIDPLQKLKENETVEIFDNVKRMISNIKSIDTAEKDGRLIPTRKASLQEAGAAS